FPDRHNYWSDPDFGDFFCHLSSNAIKRFTNTPVDISPVMDAFHAMGPNSDLNSGQLLPKLCWLLSVCGFMRPSDIQRVDVSHSSVLPSGELELQVVGPKEKRAGQHIINIKHPHLDRLFNPLIRHIFDINKAASSETISRHITKISDLLSLPPGLEKAPSGRSLDSSLFLGH
ncbi:hypothetical protein CPB97_001932, partial [Podila verticillata]